jgi:Iron-sulfur cluster binding domain of dihydroorotate dehydrogenase B
MHSWFDKTLCSHAIGRRLRAGEHRWGPLALINGTQGLCIRRPGGGTMGRKGVAANDIRVSLERNMQCGIGWCGHCQLGPLLLCRDGPVVGYAVAEPLLRVKEL